MQHFLLSRILLCYCTSTSTSYYSSSSQLLTSQRIIAIWTPSRLCSQWIKESIKQSIPPIAKVQYTKAKAPPLLTTNPLDEVRLFHPLLKIACLISSLVSNAPSLFKVLYGLPCSANSLSRGVLIFSKSQLLYTSVSTDMLTIHRLMMMTVIIAVTDQCPS